MTRFNARLWHHHAAKRLQIKPGLALDLIRRCELPDLYLHQPRDRFRPKSGQFAELERFRYKFDTPLEPFRTELRKLIALHRAGRDESVFARSLCGFVNWSQWGGPEEMGYESGEKPALNLNAYYPVAGAWFQPRRGHRVPVTAEELSAADFWTLNYQLTGDSSDLLECTVRCIIKVGPLTLNLSAGAAASKWAMYRAPRAEFLARLLTVLERRPPAPPQPKVLRDMFFQEQNGFNPTGGAS